MKIILERENGRLGRIVIAEGETLRIGRSTAVDFSCPDDAYMSAAHFAVESRNGLCQVSDLGSHNGTFLNGIKIQNGIAQNGDEISAGSAKFYMRIEKQSSIAESSKFALATSDTAVIAPPQNAGFTESQRRLLEILKEQPAHLFAILDAARDDRIVNLLRNNCERYQSLYEGKDEEDLANFAPYLVRLPGESVLLQALVKEGWGGSWGIYLTSTQSFQDVRSHFRRFLLVQTEDGKQLYFRFYDPRALRVFLPTCTPEETAHFFGSIHCILFEGENPSRIAQFFSDGQGGEREYATSAPSGKIPSLRKS